MSEPKRYQPVVQCVEPSYQAQMIEPKVMEFSEGEYVLHSDYARLKAECQARQAENSVLAVECDSLKAEVERLTKADDFIVIQRASVVSIQEVFGPEDGLDSESNWRYFIRVDKAQYDKVLKHMEEFWSAKEGKQP